MAACQNMAKYPSLLDRTQYAYLFFKPCNTREKVSLYQGTEAVSLAGVNQCDTAAVHRISPSDTS